MESGVYKLYCGEYYYLGSSSNLDSRRRDHSWRLRIGKHPNPKLQKAYDDGGVPDFQVLVSVVRSRGESDQSFRDRLRLEEQDKLGGEYGYGNPLCCNRSSSARGPDNGAVLKELWNDPDFREYVTSLNRERAKTMSAETREKMAASKRGARNHSARAVVVTLPNGLEQEFDCVTAAARWFGVKQQILDSWMRGLSPWPGTGKYTRYQRVQFFKARFKEGIEMVNPSISPYPSMSDCCYDLGVAMWAPR